MLIVEDGSGLSGAESYASVALFRQYCINRGVDSIADVSDSRCEQLLREATEYVDMVAQYSGMKLLGSQGLEFPRQACTDYSGATVTGVPRRIVDATCYLATEAENTSLTEALDRGGMITSESVGPISTSYAADAPPGTTFPRALSLLGAFVRTATNRAMQAVPSFVMPEPASFPTNMNAGYVEDT